MNNNFIDVYTINHTIKVLKLEMKSIALKSHCSSHISAVHLGSLCYSSLAPLNLQDTRAVCGSILWSVGSLRCSAFISELTRARFHFHEAFQQEKSNWRVFAGIFTRWPSLPLAASVCLFLCSYSQAFIPAAVFWTHHTALCQCGLDVLTLCSSSWHRALNIYKCRVSNGTFINREARWCHGYCFSKKCSGFIYAQYMHHISAGEKRNLKLAWILLDLTVLTGH